MQQLLLLLRLPLLPDSASSICVALVTPFFPPNPSCHFFCPQEVPRSAKPKEENHSVACVYSCSVDSISPIVSRSLLAWKHVLHTGIIIIIVVVVIICCCCCSALPAGVPCCCHSSTPLHSAYDAVSLLCGPDQPEEVPCGGNSRFRYDRIGNLVMDCCCLPRW